MINTYGIAGRYARALYDLAHEAGTADAVATQAQALAAALTGDVQAVLENPAVHHTEKAAFLEKLATSLKAGKVLVNFVQLVAAKGRAGLLGKMLAVYAQLQAAANDEVTAIVYSAAPISATQRKTIEGFVKAKAEKAKKVSIDERIDTRLVAGVRVQLGSRLYAASLADRLQALGRTLRDTTDI